MKKVKSWTSFMPILIMLLAFVLLKLTEGGTVSAYNMEVLLFLIPSSYAFEGAIQGKRCKKFLSALFFNFSIIVSMLLISWFWNVLTKVHDVWYQMYYTWGWFQVIAMYCGIYLLFLTVIYTLFYVIGWFFRKRKS